MPRIQKIDLIRTFFRSFFLQVGKNDERMQSLGFLYAILPALKRLYPEEEAKKIAQARHLEFFNTHPYFAPLILGIVIGLEEEGASREGNKFGEVAHVKSVFSGPLAALGDSFFWGNWRPFLALVACLIALFVEPRNLWAPVLFLLFYNIPHLWLRWTGVFQGYKRKTGVLAELKKISFTRLDTLVQYLMVLLLFVFGISWVVYGPGPLFEFIVGWELSGIGAISKRVVLIVSILGLSFLHRRGTSAIKLFYGITLLSIVIAYLK